VKVGLCVVGFGHILKTGFAYSIKPSQQCIEMCVIVYSGGFNLSVYLKYILALFLIILFHRQITN